MTARRPLLCCLGLHKDRETSAPNSRLQRHECARCGRERTAWRAWYDYEPADVSRPGDTGET